MVEIEIVPVGGYSDFGRNMTCVRVGGEAVILDMGIRLDRVLLDEEAVFDEMHPKDLQRLGAIPDDSVVRSLGSKVVAIVLGHGHLDHVGAVAKLAPHYPQAPLYATPYTLKLVEGMGRTGGKGRSLPNKLVPLEAGERRPIGKNLTLEFVHVTHSIPQTVFPVLHTPEGAIVYANDYKFDNMPVLGSKPDYSRLKGLSLEGVLALIVESTNAGEETKTPSETIARDMLRDFLFGIENDRSGIIVSTFSSHIARLKSIAEFGEKLGRRVLFLGRSMEKYASTAQRLGLVSFPSSCRILGRSKDVEQALSHVMKEKSRYLLVATGHQGEPGSLLDRIANRQHTYRVEPDDQIIFSANVIPHPINQSNRYLLETKLNMQKARIIKGAHVSGHASREDHRELLKMLEPRHIFPAHGGIDLQSKFLELAERMGYALHETVHILRNGQRFVLPKERI